MSKQRNESTSASSAGQIQESSAAYSESTLRLRVLEAALTGHNLAFVFSTLTDLYVKLLLLERGRLGELVYFNQTRELDCYDEAPLAIRSLMQNSPLRIALNVGPAIGQAIASIIDAVALTPARYKAAQLANQQMEQRAKAEYQEALTRGRSAEDARRLAQQQQQMATAGEAVRLARERLDAEAHRLQVALETAQMATAMLAPNLALEAQYMVVVSLLPEILRLGDTQGLSVDRALY